MITQLPKGLIMFNSKIKINALLVLAVLLMTSCELYETLYGEPPTGGVPAIDDAFLMPEVNETEVPIEENLTGRVEENITEVKEEKELEELNVIIVEETDLVSLQPKVEDPDRDELIFAYTSPLDNKGEWQTTYGDKGEYTVTITVSDGQLTDSKEVLLIVKKKEEAPTIDGISPIEKAVFVDETSEMEFSVKASDLNNDPLLYEWKLDGEIVEEDTSYVYAPDYEAAGSHTLKVDVKDDTSTVNNIWSITVNNVNRLPRVKDLEDIIVKETEEVVVIVDAFDEDEDELIYTIDDNRFIEQGEGVFVWATDYDSAGKYTVKVTVNDGTDTVEKEANVEVENVNRAPVIIDIVQKQ